MSAADKHSGSPKCWLPLEADPSLLTEYIQLLGGPAVRCVDVLSTDEWALQLIPRPVHALLLAFPTDGSRQDTPAAAATEDNGDQKVWFSRQTIGGACGTMAVLHAMANLTHRLSVANGGFLERFLAHTANLSPQQRAEAIEKSAELARLHTSVEERGQSTLPERGQRVGTHYAAFVAVGGTLYELDGRKSGPVDHGETNEEGFLRDCVAVARGLMARRPDEMRFAMIAVVPADQCAQPDSKE
ncbi:unnamed protein product [Vitrella brassicaformis CCMP3155]|uniref:Ubiquitin carboxyl-terminal hydrolase n=1 Tax=Vitrella brassicaformis (strain CCMP3155) TaxID=1169540 RepID=A0A0G4H7T2_VITBC|nr:unnamed protein product [Vitrella brassicaformis CCMP3155]|eukprot:CEM39732.1 unnamed protein product [Vitrella brassicaformis CCMP3155]